MPRSPLDLDATDLIAALASDEWTVAEVARLFLDRIAAHNPRLRAVITVNPDAEADAQALDRLPREGRGPLHGLPMLIKDNLDVAGLPTTAGSRRLREHTPAQDAPVVARLRAAGAVILGKANMTEWANFMTLGMPNGYSTHGGQTVSPWGADLDTGGSSSGSGVGVAARLCAAAIGTETSGSIVSPAHQNGVVGLKPTLGLVPRTGIVPISHSQDTAGPVARSARDAALILRVIAGPDARDPATAAWPTLPETAGALARLRVALINDTRPPTDPETSAMEEVAQALAAGGAEVARVPFPSRAALRQPGGEMLDVLLYEFKGDLNAYLSGVEHGPGTLAEVIAGNDADAEASLRFGQALLHAAEGTRGDAGERAYTLARERDLLLSRTQGFDVLFAAHDVALFPGIHGYALAAKAGYPSVALPTPPQDGKPAGALLVARAGEDLRLLAVAQALLDRLGGVALPELA